MSNAGTDDVRGLVVAQLQVVLNHMKQDSVLDFQRLLHRVLTEDQATCDESRSVLLRRAWKSLLAPLARRGEVLTELRKALDL